MAGQPTSLLAQFGDDIRSLPDDGVRPPGMTTIDLDIGMISLGDAEVSDGD